MQKRLLIACVWVILIVGGIGSANAQMPPENVLLFAYSPASNQIAIDVTVPDTGDGRSQSIAEIYDAVSGEYLGFIPAQETGFIYLQFNATGDRLTTVTADNNVDTWDVSTFTRTEPSLPGGVFEAGPIAWNPQNDWLAASLARQVYISSAESPDVIIFGDEATTSGITDMGWSPDGNTLAISTYDIHTETQQITIWDAFGGNLRPTEPILRIVGDSTGLLDWEPDGTAIAASTVDGVVIYDAATGGTVQRLQTDQGPGYMFEVRWSPDGRQIAAGFQYDLWIWDVSTGAAVVHYTMPQPVRNIVWLPNGQVLHNGGEIGLAINGIRIEGFVIPVVQPPPSPTFTTTPTPTLTLTPTFTPTFTPTHTPTFTPTPDTTCTVTVANPAALVNAINAANSNGTSADTICLEEGTYTFLSASNSIALPSITTPITIVVTGEVTVLTEGLAGPAWVLPIPQVEHLAPPSPTAITRELMP